MTEYKETVSSLYFSLAPNVRSTTSKTFSPRTRTLELSKHLANQVTIALPALARKQNPSTRRASRCRSLTSRLQSARDAEISTVSTPSQKHPASFQVFNKALHVIDVGLAHALTSGIVKHVETLGTLFVVSSVRAKAPQKVTTSKENNTSFRKDRHRLHPRARTPNDRTAERR